MYPDDKNRMILDVEDVLDLLLQNPNVDFSRVYLEDPSEQEKFKNSCYKRFLDHRDFCFYSGNDTDDFHHRQQSNWYMPTEYKDMDIAKWCLDQCNTDEELQRVGEELIMYQERDLFSLLKFMKFMVDTMRKNNVVWGVGRGSSVASYVLFLIGVHKIDSLYYDLDIREFLR